MPGYADRLLHIEFPHLTLPGETTVFVAFRNPRLVPMSILQGDDVPTDPATGRPLDAKQAEQAMYKSMATLIKDWHVYDAADDTDDPPLLPLPATPEAVAKLPSEIQQAIVKEVEKAASPR